MKNDKSDDELETESQKEKKRDEEEVEVFEPPALLPVELKDLLEAKFAEYSDLKVRMDEVKRLEEEERKRLEEKNREEEIAHSHRSMEYTLKSLHQVVRNKEIVRYLEGIGEIIVFESNRGYGKNAIIFSRRDHSKVETALKNLYDRQTEIEQSKKKSEDKRIEKEKIEEDIKTMEDKLAYLEDAGGVMYLYHEQKKRFYLLDYYSREKNVRARSLALLRVYFGKNEFFEDSFREFNTPERIMTLIQKNLQADNVENEIVKLRKRLTE